MKYALIQFFQRIRLTIWKYSPSMFIYTLFLSYSVKLGFSLNFMKIESPPWYNILFNHPIIISNPVVINFPFFLFIKIYFKLLYLLNLNLEFLLYQYYFFLYLFIKNYSTFIFIFVKK